MGGNKNPIFIDICFHIVLVIFLIVLTNYLTKNQLKGKKDLFWLTAQGNFYHLPWWGTTLKTQLSIFHLQQESRVNRKTTKQSYETSNPYFRDLFLPIRLCLQNIPTTAINATKWMEISVQTHESTFKPFTFKPQPPGIVTAAQGRTMDVALSL